MNIRFKEIEEKDFTFIKNVYDYYILNTTSTYYTEPISIEELKEFIFTADKKYRSFLILAGSEPCGFCYLTRYKNRQAYDRTAEISLYLKPGFTGSGIGFHAVELLEKVARENGISVLMGVISGDNEYSIKLIERCGYVKCGHFRQVGEKFNKVLDVVTYQKIL